MNIFSFRQFIRLSLAIATGIIISVVLLWVLMVGVTWFSDTKIEHEMPVGNFRARAYPADSIVSPTIAEPDGLAPALK